jgi:hypothetical protein
VVKTLRPQAERYNARNVTQRQLKKAKSGQEVVSNKCLSSSMNCFGTKITGMIHFGAGKIRKSPGTPAAKLWLSEMQGLIYEAQCNADQQGDSQDV